MKVSAVSAERYLRASSVRGDKPLNGIPSVPLLPGHFPGSTWDVSFLSTPPSANSWI